MVCIDQRRTHGQGLAWTQIPNGAEDRSGLSLQECAFAQAREFFVGLSSGLSWLAWAAGIPVVMISGFTHPTTEFETPWQVINYHTCKQLLERPGAPVRLQGLPLVPAPRRHAAPVRMHAADHDRACQARAAEAAELRCWSRRAPEVEANRHDGDDADAETTARGSSAPDLSRRRWPETNGPKGVGSGSRAPSHRFAQRARDASPDQIRRLRS